MPQCQRELPTIVEQLDQLLPQARWRLRQRWQALSQQHDQQLHARLLAALLADIANAQQQVAARVQACPTLIYPPMLPVTQQKPLLLAAIRDHPVVIVAGETGSGKTTQLPKICLELGRAANGLIGHTQPRRLAARTVAQRLAEELQIQLGGVVGYQVRFNEQVSDNTLVKVMTDGILLAEMQHDRLLNRYGTLIIDEAHERSLTIDFILGYLKQLLPQRPDLKVIITSATLDPQRFSRHFDHAPIIEIAGRSYPVEVRYRPIAAEHGGDQDQSQAIIEAVNELNSEPLGDILIFMSGEREIRETAEQLIEQSVKQSVEKSVEKQWPPTEILPLYARLSATEQHQIFKPHYGRRIVLATNVAETSLTVPGIKYVIDPGKARISRYSYRSKVQQLPIEPISQAAANQRKGRCGRLSAGVCIRLYSELDFFNRPLFTEPAILRTNLAAVILQLLASGLGDIETFPFIDPPDRRYLNDGLRLLHELGAIPQPAGVAARQLTALGHQLAQLPLDPRLARMVLAAQALGCVHELLIITTALSIQDPRERPIEKQQAADQQHRRFEDKQSDFLSWIALWDHLQRQQQQLSNSAFSKRCRAEFLNPQRIREWQDLYSQVRQAVKRLPLTINTQPADYRTIHCALLSGLLSQIGQKALENPGFRGARNLNFSLFPGSALFKKPPKWVVVAELVTTSRLWGRTAARIEPDWLEALAGHLLKRSYSEPHWEQRSGSAVAIEKITLYGLPIISDRKVHYGRLDPARARELFIRHALVAGEWHAKYQFLQHNLQCLAEAEILEHKARRRDLVVDAETLFNFYDQQLPTEVVSAAHFDRWWKKIGTCQPHLLDFAPEMLLNQTATPVSADAYPDSWQQGSLQLPLHYQFTPGEAADGVTLQIPLPLLPHVTPVGFEWQVPGLRSELITALIKSLPKSLRRNFVPVPNYVEAFLQQEIPIERPLLAALTEILYRMTGVTVSPEAWDWQQLPDHLKITFQVVDACGNPLACSHNLSALQQQLKAQAIQQLAILTPNTLEQQGLRDWTFGTLPSSIEQRHQHYRFQRFPALVDQQQSVAIQLFASEAEQRAAMLEGTVRLLWLSLPSPLKLLQQQLDNQAKLSLAIYPSTQPLAMLEDCLLASLQQLLLQQGGVVWDQAAFCQRRQQIRGQLNTTVVPVVQQVATILIRYQTLQTRLQQPCHLNIALAVADMQQQLRHLIYPGFVRASGLPRLPDLLRYLGALQQRLDKLPTQAQSDQVQRLKIAEITQAYQQVYQKQLAAPSTALHPSENLQSESLQQVRWMIEELRVSYFAQQLGTPYPISEKRIYRVLQSLSGTLSGPPSATH